MTVRLERSELAVPASSWRMIEKAVSSMADVVFLDLEDAVAPDAKVASRTNVVRALRELDWGKKPPAYRVNGLDTPLFYRDVIEVVETAGDRLAIIVIPKVGRPEDLVTVDTLLSQTFSYLQADLHHARVGDDSYIVALALDVALANRHQHLTIGHVALEGAVEQGMLDVHHRVVVANRRFEQTLVVIRRGRHHHFQPRRVREPCLERLRVRGGELGPAGRGADNQGHADLAAEHGV